MLTPLPPQAARRVTEFLRSAGFTTEGLRHLLQAGDLPSRRLRNLPRLLYLTDGPGVLQTLVHWFLLEVPVADPGPWIPGPILADLQECGLLVNVPGGLQSTAMLVPFEHIYLATDHASRLEAGDDPQVVLGLNSTTFLLLHATVRRRVRRVLDFGGGNGIQALLAAPHSESVIATDLNPRATEFAVFNAALNEYPHLECRTGDSFAPVTGLRFDLIVANPPFFITPSSMNLYCDNPLDLDLFCRRLVREAPAYLEEGGLLQMVCEWVEIAGQPWPDRIREWGEGTGCDLWVLKGYTEQPSLYCQKRLAETRPYDPQNDRVTFNEWMTYFEQRQVNAVHGGVLTLRRRAAASHWVSCEDMPGAGKSDFGEDIERGVRIRDFLHQNPADEQLLAASFQPVPSLLWEQQAQLGEHNWVPFRSQLRSGSPLAFHQPVDPLVARFVACLDPALPLADAVARFGTEIGAPPEQVQAECLAIVRRLLSRDLLLPGS